MLGLKLIIRVSKTSHWPLSLFWNSLILKSPELIAYHAPVEEMYGYPTFESVVVAFEAIVRYQFSSTSNGRQRISPGGHSRDYQTDTVWSLKNHCSWFTTELYKYILIIIQCHRALKERNLRNSQHVGSIFNSPIFHPIHCYRWWNMKANHHKVSIHVEWSKWWLTSFW